MTKTQAKHMATSAPSRAACVSGLSLELLTFGLGRMIRPSAAASRSTLELSNSDRMNDFYYTLILFYEAQAEGPNRSSENAASVIERAMEELLGHYPAAAGRLRVNEAQKRLEVDCNGDGVYFVATHARLPLSHLGDFASAHPSFDLLMPSMPSQGHNGPPLVAIQVTSFMCGGFTLSIKINHILADGHSVAVFLQNLCSIARGGGLLVPFDQVSRRVRIKPTIPPAPKFQHPNITTKEEWEKISSLASPLLTPRRGNATILSFSASSLEMLRQRALLEDEHLQYCSRYQALVALLWKARAKSLLGNGHDFTSSQELPIRLPVNFRERRLPTLTRGYMGNGMCPTTASASMQELLELPLSILVHKIRAALDVATPEFLQSRVDYLELIGLLEAHPVRFFFGMSSLVSLPFYNTDCGWGCPAYCAVPSQQWNNALYILQGRAKRSWNVSVVFESKEEQALFVGAVEEYVAVSIRHGSPEGRSFHASALLASLKYETDDFLRSSLSPLDKFVASSREKD